MSGFFCLITPPMKKEFTHQGPGYADALLLATQYNMYTKP
jgi:hypothetical protein